MPSEISPSEGVGQKQPKLRTRVSREFVLERFYSAIVREEKPGGIPENAIGVTDLCYKCIRRAWFARKYESRFFDLQTQIAMWIGKTIHKSQLLSKSEMILAWSPEPGTKYPVVGIADDFDPELGLLIEKKSIRNIIGRKGPRLPFDHHVDQVQIYCFLLHKNGYKINDAYLLYIDVDQRMVEPFRVELEPMDQIEQLVRSRWEQLVRAIETDQPPAKTITRACEFCEWPGVCFK